MNRYYVGDRFQKGYGLGGRRINQKGGFGLGGLFSKFKSLITPFLTKAKNYALPLLKTGAKTVGKELVKATSSIANDILDGRNINESTKDRVSTSLDDLSKRGKEQLRNSINDLSTIAKDQFSGQGLKKSNINKRKLLKKNVTFKKRKNKRTLDIFS